MLPTRASEESNHNKLLTSLPVPCGFMGFGWVLGLSMPEPWAHCGSVDWERSGTHNPKSKVLDAPFFVGRPPTGRYGTIVLAGANVSVEEAAACQPLTARASASPGGANE